MLTKSEACDTLARFRAWRPRGGEMPPDLAESLEDLAVAACGARWLLQERNAYIVAAALELSGEPWSRAEILADTSRRISRVSPAKLDPTGAAAFEASLIAARGYAPLPTTANGCYRVIKDAVLTNAFALDR